MDENGMPLAHKPPKVIACKGAKKTHCCKSGNKAQVTILAYANAASTTLPPMVILILMDNDSIQNGVRGKYQIHFMARQRRGGLTMNCFSSG